MAKFTNCLELISRIDERDQAALVARLDELIDGGMSPSEAQAQAAVDVLASVEREGGLEAEPADLSSFEVGQLPELLRKSGWAILTAENPGGNQASEQDNAAANARLIAELRQRGLKFLPVVGRYGGTDESSFAIVGISAQEAADLGRRHGQEAVLTRDGFVYQDGSINPAKGIEVFKEPPEDFFSRVTTGAGDAYFRVDIDFDTRIGGPENATMSADRTESVVSDRGGNQYRMTVSKQSFGFGATGPNSVLVELRDIDSGDRRAFVDFAIRDDGVLVAENAKVAPQFRRRGLAAMMYRGARDAGYDIAPGRVQTADGEAMVEALQRSGIINREAASPRTRADDLRSTDRPRFYSQLSRAIEQAPDRVASQSAAQWKLWLDANAPKLGVKKDEVEWSGIKDWLDLQGKTKLSREDLTAYLADSGVRVTETVLGEASPHTEFGDDDIRDASEFLREHTGLSKRDFDEEYDGWDDADIIESANEFYREAYPDSAVPTKYGSYTVPGGENYREVLITLPSVPRNDRPQPLNALPTGYEAIFDSQEQPGQQWGITEPGQMHARPWAGRHADPETARAAALKKLNAERLGKWQDAAPQYRSGHWDQPNILAHIRVDDRTDADGKRVLFINEIQSDWGSDGRKKGFDKPPMKGEVRPQDGYDPALSDQWEAEDAGAGPTWAVYWEDGTFSGGYDSQEAAERRLRDAARSKAGSVPRGPFVEDTKSYVALALKRAIMLAVEEGHDKIAIITGQQAADLYDLSKRVKSIGYTPNEDGTFKLYINGMDNETLVDEKNATLDRIESLAGKEIAAKVSKGEGRPMQGSGPDTGFRSLTGLDLKVGGEGMRAFYDQIIPQVANDVLKKIGGGKVGEVEFGSRFDVIESSGGWVVRDSKTGGYYRGDRASTPWTDEPQRAKVFLSEASANGAADALDAGEPGPAVQPGFDITPEMREKIRSEGLPLFSRDRITETPEFKRWFGDSKVVDAEGKPLVVYHGTDQSFDSFATEKLGQATGAMSAAQGFFFVARPDAAASYANYAAMEAPVRREIAQSERAQKRGDWDGYDEALGRAEALESEIADNPQRGQNVLPVYLRIENPAVMDARGELFTSLRSEINAFIRKAKRDGRDGVIIRNLDDDPRFHDRVGDHFVAFRPEQIKSAIGNRGAFDAADPDITRSADRITDSDAFKRWFGDSKVVDESGRPMVVYHGTVVRDSARAPGMGDIVAFDRMFTTRFRAASIDNVGSWFSSNPGAGGAEMYSGRGPGSAIYPAYLSIKNPHVTTFALMLRRARLLANGKDDGRRIGEAEVEAFRKWLMDTGRDGIKIESSGSDASTEFDNQDAWIALEPNQVKSAVGNAGSFDPGSPDITRSRDRGVYQSADRPRFYSQLSRAIEQAPDRVASQSAAQWKLWLDANAPKLGVKKDEVEWSGIKDYLDLQGKAKVTRDQLVAYLADSGVRVQEVVLGDKPEEPDWRNVQPSDLPDGFVSGRDASFRHSDGYTSKVGVFESESGMWWAYQDGQELAEDTSEQLAVEAAVEAIKKDAERDPDSGSVRYDGYVVPGGENYREVLITLPLKPRPAAPPAPMHTVYDAGFAITRDPEEAARWRAMGRDVVERQEPDRLANLSAAADHERESDRLNYKSSHWSQPNVIAHLRVDDRTDADGKRVLFINEVQSDWGQDGKKKGFKGEQIPAYQVQWSGRPIMTYETRQEADDHVARALAAAPDAPVTVAEVFAGHHGADPRELQKVPRAPFITDTKAWVSLALKRAIMMAVEGGYDRVALITGQQAADLYDLSKQVDSVVAYKVDGGYKISARALDGDALPAQSAKNEQELADIVGKELAERIVRDLNAEGMGDSAVQAYSGLDLKVGGEGMRTFYDEIVPQVARDVLKKIGGGRVGEVKFSAPPRRDDGPVSGTMVMERLGIPEAQQSTYWRELDQDERDRLIDEYRNREPGEGEVSQPGFDITPEMREKIRSEGLPLFSRDRITETPEFKRWFGNSKVVGDDGKPLVVYHGTGADFNSFRGPAYFTGSPGQAADYARNRADADGEPGRSIPVYLSIQNPKIAPTEYIEWAGYDDSEISKAISDGHDGFMNEAKTEIVAFRPNQIKSAIGNLGTFDPSDSDITRSSDRAGAQDSLKLSTGRAWDTPSASKWDDMVYKLQDKQIDTKRVVEAVREASGAISDDLDVYLREELFHGRTAKRSQDFVDRELQPLVDGMAKDGLKIEELDEFLHARHAREANAVIASRNPTLQDGGSGMLNQDAEAYFAQLTEGKREALERAAAKVDAMIARTRQLMVDYELESPKVVDGWASMFKHYVPLMREEDSPAGTGQGFSIRGKEVKSRTGSTRKVVDILANIAMQRERTIVRGEKNRVSRALFGLAAIAPNDDFWTVDTNVPTEQVFNPKTGLVERRVDNLYKQRPNVVVTKVLDGDGNLSERAVIFNERNERALRAAAALKNLDAAQLEGLLGASAQVTRYFASINTQYNPVFGVVNLVRDIQGAMLNLGSTDLAGQQRRIATDTIKAIRAVYSDARATRKGGAASSRWAQLWEEFQEVGGQTGFRELFRTSADRAKAIERALDPDAWMSSRLGRIFTANGALKVPMSVAARAARWLFDWLSDYNLAMENGVRLATYKAGLDAGLSKERAASIAKNLTTNFNRRGQIGQQAGAVYAFFNASMQGTARIGQTIFEMKPGKPNTIRLSPLGKKVVYGGMLLGSLQSLMLAAAGFTEDDPPEWARERGLIIPTGGKSYITIPMPLGFHVIPGLGRTATDFALRGFTDPARYATTVIGMFADAFNPIGNAGLSMQTISPTALDPLVAITENRDWSGRPIARESRNPAVPGHELARDTSTAISRLLSEGINYMTGGTKYTAGVLSPTPDQIDYLAGQVGGGVWRELSKVEQTAKSLVTGESLPTYKVPLVGRFVGSSASQASEGTAFYANVDRLNRLETEIKGLQEDGRREEAAALRRGQPMALLIGKANAAEREIQRLRKQKSELVKAGADRAQVRAVEEKITAAMARLNRAVEEARASE